LATRDDLEALHHRHTGRHHGRKLAAEHRDVAACDLPAGFAKQRFWLGFDDLRVDTLLAQVGLDQVRVLADRFALDLDATLVEPDPSEGLQFGDLGAVTPALG